VCDIFVGIWLILIRGRSDRGGLVVRLRPDGSQRLLAAQGEDSRGLGDRPQAHAKAMLTELLDRRVTNPGGRRQIS
jgi:hypothetical protein